MLSFALVYAGNFDGMAFRKPENWDCHFSREVRPISGNFQPEALQVNGIDRERLLASAPEPTVATREAAAWVREVAGLGTPVLVAYPLSFDWSLCGGESRSLWRGGKICRRSFGPRAGTVTGRWRTRSSKLKFLPASLPGRKRLGELLNNRRSETRGRIEKLRSRLVKAEERCGVAACVYTTGSVGREETGPQSDLDLFIADLGTAGKRKLSRSDEILIAADLIQKSQSVDEVVARYWRDYEDHKDDFVPAFLTNDILRMWRTFCVNYEAKRRDVPPEEKAKAKLKHFKLGHSRLLTCYSALLFLLHVYGQRGSVRPEDAQRMVSLTPTERLQHLESEVTTSDLKRQVGRLLGKYEAFLETTNKPADELLERFAGTEAEGLAKQAHRFGEAVFDCLQAMGDAGKHRELLRFLIV